MSTQSPPPDAVIRDATDKDVAAIQAIYTPHVLTGTASFEEVPPTVEQMAARYADVRRLGLPYLVAEHAGRVIGYAYASAYRPRIAYRNTIEDSVYLAPDHHGRGVGRALLTTLIARCEAGPWRQMIAVIGDSGNAGSIALHERLGFRSVGVFRNVGWKLGRWLDTVLMQRSLGRGGDDPPA